MHPILAQRRRLGLYLLLFLQVGWLLGELVAGSAGMPRAAAMLWTIPLLVMHSFSCLASWYLCRSFPLSTDRPERPAVTLVAAALLAGALVTGIGAGWGRALEHWLALPEGTFADGAVLIFVFALLLFSLAVAVHYLFIAFESSRQAEGRAYELRLLAREAELKALKAQIDPHFLFNSLNSISGLVVADPERARGMCVELAGFLRRSLRLGALESIPLADEMALAESYLAVEQVRFGERLRVERSLAPGCEVCPVPPLLLQPLVENAVRHGVAHLLAGGAVTLGAELRGARLHVVVENPRDPEAAAGRGEGIGLTNVRRRLEAAFGDEADLAVDAHPERFRVRLTLPAQRTDNPEHRSAVALPPAPAAQKIPVSA